MYMFAQNSIKKIALVISTLQMRYYLYLLLPSLHLRFSFALNPFQIRSIVESRMGGRWESHGTYMGGRREQEKMKNTRPSKSPLEGDFFCTLALPPLRGSRERVGIFHFSSIFLLQKHYRFARGTGGHLCNRYVNGLQRVFQMMGWRSRRRAPPFRWKGSTPNLYRGSTVYQP